MSLKSLKENLLKDNNFSKEYFDKTNIAFEVAEMVKEERMKNGLTQKDLAKLLKTKQSSIARLERGNCLPSLNFLEKIAQALNTKLLPPKFLSMSESKTIIIMNQTSYFSGILSRIKANSVITKIENIN